MFKKHSLEVKVVKTPRVSTSTETTEPKQFDIDKVNDLAMKSMQTLAIGFVGVYTVVKVLNTASEIAINAAPKR
jgi:hypothetical protein